MLAVIKREGTCMWCGLVAEPRKNMQVNLPLKNVLLNPSSGASLHQASAADGPDS